MDDAIRNIEEMEEKIRVLTRKKDLLKEICKKAGKEIRELKHDNKLLANDIADMNKVIESFEEKLRNKPTIINQVIFKFGQYPAQKKKGDISNEQNPDPGCQASFHIKAKLIHLLNSLVV